MKITIVNRLYPPIPGVTGESAFQLANYLRKHYGAFVSVVHAHSRYYGATQQLDIESTVYAIPSIYSGRFKPLRFMASLIDGYRMVKKARRLDSDAIILMTDPPLLAMWGSVLLRKKHPWVLWSMDIYPQAFVAGGLVTEHNPVYRYLFRKTFSQSPALLIALGEKQQQYIESAFGQSLPTVAFPCGITGDITKGDKPEWYQSDKIIFGYCGNLGEAHDVRFVEAILPLIDPERHIFILAPYGRHADEILKKAVRYEGVVIQKFVSREQLAYIDIHLVSLLDKWTHICVPSKAFTAVCLGAAILYNGAESGDVWYKLREAGWYVPTGENMADEMASLVKHLNKPDVEDKRRAAARLASKLMDMEKSALKSIGDALSAPPFADRDTNTNQS